MRLIDADAYAAEMKTRQDACKETIDNAVEDERCEVYDRMSSAYSVFIEAKLTLDAMPTIDAVPVVRCGRCEYYSNEMNCCSYVNGLQNVTKTDYCSYGRCADGERRTDEQ